MLDKKALDVEHGLLFKIGLSIAGEPAPTIAGASRLPSVLHRDVIAAHAPHQTKLPTPHDSLAPHPPLAWPRRNIRFCVRVTIWRVGGW